MAMLDDFTVDATLAEGGAIWSPPKPTPADASQDYLALYERERARADAAEARYLLLQQPHASQRSLEDLPEVRLERMRVGARQQAGEVAESLAERLHIVIVVKAVGVKENFSRTSGEFTAATQQREERLGTEQHLLDPSRIAEHLQRVHVRDRTLVGGDDRDVVRLVEEQKLRATEPQIALRGSAQITRGRASARRVLLLAGPAPRRSIIRAEM